MTTIKKKCWVTTEEKVKIAYKNGYRAGHDEGFKEGYDIAYENITRHLQSMLRGRKKAEQNKKVKAVCWNCLTGRNEMEIKVGGYILPTPKHKKR